MNHSEPTFTAVSKIAAVVICLLLAGCGSSGPRTYRIPGRLVYDDNSPVAGASVALKTKIDGKEISALGMASPEGKFTLTTFKDGDGVVAGEHQVAVYPLPVPDGVKKPQPQIHGMYWVFETSGLTTTVEPGTKLIEIKIVRGK